MRRDLFVLMMAAFAVLFPLPGLPQSATSALMSKSPRIDIKALMNKANSGDPEAQFGLGAVYQQGLGVDKSEYQAMRWYRLAANSGHTERPTRVMNPVFARKATEHGYQNVFYHTVARR
jgi:TPR repeat protein